MQTNPYYKKTISLKYQNKELQFHVSQELFSSYQVDVGTQRLLRTFIFEEIQNYNKVLDLGCGYGPIGITLKIIQPSVELHMVDRDALALEFALENAKLNQVSKDTQVYSSLGYDAVEDRDFDLIVSNIPAKVGEEVLAHIIHDAKHFLQPGGKVTIVVIDAIADFVTAELQDESIVVEYKRSWPGHTVFHFSFVGGTSIATAGEDGYSKGIYTRSLKSFVCNNRSINLTTAYHLPEFNELSHDTELLLKLLEKQEQTFKYPLIYNPGQGYVPVCLAQYEQIAKITLVDRNSLSLQVSRDNLIANGIDENSIEIFHQVRLLPEKSATNVDAVFALLPEQQNIAVCEQLVADASAVLQHGGDIYLVSSSTVITRVEDLIAQDKKCIIQQRQRERGRSVLMLKCLS